jgi:hypothetical protein
MHISKNISFHIALALVTSGITTRVFSNSEIVVNMSALTFFIEIFVIIICLEIIALILLNPIKLEPYSTDENVCNIRVINKNKTKNIEDCWCRTEAIFVFDDNGKPNNVTQITDRDNLKFLWDGINKEIVTISRDDHEILNISKVNPKDNKMFFDILHSKSPEPFQVFKNKNGQFEGKVRMKFKVFGKQEGGVVYSRSITRDIILRTYVDEIDGQSKENIDLRFEKPS